MSTRDQQQAKYWPTPKAYAALTTNPDGPINPLAEDGAALLERAVLDGGLAKLRNGKADQGVIPQEVHDVVNILEILVALRDAS